MLKSIYSALFLCNSASSNKAQTCYQSIPCPNHPHQVITAFCLKEQCLTPYVCSECKSHHQKGHSSSFVPVQRLLNDQFATCFAKNLETRFSSNRIESIHQEVTAVFKKMEDEILHSIRELKKDAEEYFINLSENVEKFRTAYENYSGLSNLVSKSGMNVEQIKNLVENYRILKQNTKIFDLNLETIPENLQRELDPALTKFKFEVLAKLTESLDLKPMDFFKLKVKASHSIPCSEGVLYEACAFIPKWNLLAVGFRKNQQGSLGLYNLESQELVSCAENVHKRWINHVIWVEKWNYIVTCSNDMKIKVFAASNQGKSIKAIATFQGHTNLVRCIKYLEGEDLLVSAGDDPDIKVWDLKRLKRFATISTNCNTNMDGSIAYIPKEKLVGIGFRSGFIRFYHLYKRNLVFEFQTGFENFYTYGLQYLPKRKLILGRVKERVIKVWKYDDDKKKVELYKTINAKGNYPDCIVANEDESQLLFTSRDQFLEMYDFGTDKTDTYNLKPHIKKTNALVYLSNLGKVSVCDYTSGKICILH